MRSKGESEETYRDKLVESRTELDAAVEFTKKNKARMSPLVQARENALTSGAVETEAKNLKSLEIKYLKLVSDLEYRDTRSSARQRIPELTSEYQQISIKALKTHYLGEAKNNLALAKDENANELVPKTFKETAASIKKAEDLIEKDQRAVSMPIIAELSQEALLSSRRLLELNGQSKTMKTLSPEELSLMSESAKAKAKAEAAQTELQLKKAEGMVSELQEKTNELSQLEPGAQLNQKFASVQAMFTEEEAKVYRQGNNLVISLKKINFPVNASTIPNPSFESLKKIQAAIRSFGDPTIVIEGHTDSTGDTAMNKALSEERAKAVKAYLLSNTVIAPEKIEVVGYGSEKPLASNKTSQGRAINRRIDIVIKE